MLRQYLAKVTTSNSGKSDTVRLLEQATLLSFHRMCGQRTVLTSTLSTTRCETSSSAESISRGCTTLMNWSSVCCMFGMALTRPSLTMQLTSGVGVLAHVGGQNTDTLSNYILTLVSHMTRDVSVFVKCDTIYRCFLQLPQIPTSNFHKVVWQRTKGMVGSIIWILLKLYFSFQQ